MAPRLPPSAPPAWARPVGWRGFWIGLTVYALWAAALAFALGRPVGAADLWLVLPLTFLYTGLFITAHDAMHGVAGPTPVINRGLGALCAASYALFSFTRLQRAHARHHARPAGPEDPDWHDGRRPGFWRWYAHFMASYVTWPQLLGMGVAFQALHFGLGVGIAQLFVFWMAPNLLSTLQLFAFGTYLPHREPPGGHDNAHRARSNGWPAWASFLSCYHFGRHLEHHAHPAVPWWRLANVPAEAARGPTS